MAEESPEDKIIEFYYALFDAVFSEPFRGLIDSRRRRDTVIRQVQDAAAAASERLMRFAVARQITGTDLDRLLDSLAPLGERVDLDRISRSSKTPESLANELLADDWPATFESGDDSEAVFRVVIHSLVQVLSTVGPIMAEWKKLNFSESFDMPKQVVRRLNQLSGDLEALGISGTSANDDRYELLYRDHLIQRFDRIELGTVRMTTNLNVDLGELFVVPRLRLQEPPTGPDAGKSDDDIELMDLSKARERKRLQSPPRGESGEESVSGPLDLLEDCARLVIIGAPGSGKSTLLEWWQQQIASATLEFVVGGRQAIPLLLKIRQLDPENLPRGPELVAAAIESTDQAALMPDGWIIRQLEAGRVLIMIDGLDEADSLQRETKIIPWLKELVKTFPKARFVVSSRPVGYDGGGLAELEFDESELLDFDESQVRAFANNWCSAVRLARNESREEARREGEREGGEIVAAFQDYRDVADLARTPLMLSAVCLVYYFENGKLPDDRALLYRLCVEGLLHSWDVRRGIHSEFGFDEKLRACRELALAMQANNLAEIEMAEVADCFAKILQSIERSRQLLEHIRNRSGLLIERRPEIFAFAHLTFQEYLAACAVVEGNHLEITGTQLIAELSDGRWREVMPLYCGIAPNALTADFLKRLIGEENQPYPASVLVDCYAAGGAPIRGDTTMRKKVIRRVLSADLDQAIPFEVFPIDEVSSIANELVGSTQTLAGLNCRHYFFTRYPDQINWKPIREKIAIASDLSRIGLTEIVLLVHEFGGVEEITECVNHPEIYRLPGGLGTGGDLTLLAFQIRFGINWESFPGHDEGFVRIFEQALLLALRSMDASIYRTDNHFRFFSAFLEGQLPNLNRVSEIVAALESHSPEDLEILGFQALLEKTKAYPATPKENE